MTGLPNNGRNQCGIPQLIMNVVSGLFRVLGMPLLGKNVTFSYARHPKWCLAVANMFCSCSRCVECCMLLQLQELLP